MATPRNPMRRRLALAAAALASLGGRAGTVAAQAGAGTLRLVVPYAPGGVGDQLARAVAERIGPVLGQRVLVDNKPGGGTVIGTQLALTAPADGQTLLFVAASFVIQPQLAARPVYDAARDFAPLALMASNPHLLVVHPSVPAATLKELAAWAQTRQGAAAFASFGNGSSGHLGFELLKKAAGFDMVHVPYKGGAPAMQDLLAGQVAAMLTDLPQAVAHVKDAGDVRRRNDDDEGFNPVGFLARTWLEKAARFPCRVDAVLKILRVIRLLELNCLHVSLFLMAKYYTSKGVLA